jgi:hypothetical protein
MPVLGVGRRRGRSTLVLRHGRDLFAATADRGSDPDRSGVLKSLQDILTSSGLHRDTLQSVVFARNTAWGDAARPLRLGRDWARASLSQVELYGVSTTAALAAHALALLPGDGLAIVGDDSAAAFSGRPGRLQAAGRMANAEVVLGSARHVAAALGLETQSPLDRRAEVGSLERPVEWYRRQGAW